MFVLCSTCCLQRLNTNIFLVWLMVALNIRPCCLDEESRIKYIKNNLGVLVNEPQWNLNIRGIRSIFEGLT